MGQEAKPTNGSAAAGGGIFSMQAMQRHLDGIYIGYRPGDPTAGPPPAAMPAPAVEPAAGSRVIDLRGMSMAQLMAEAATTHSRDFFAALLPNPPGVPPERLAYVTGHAPVQEAEEQLHQQQQEQRAVQPRQPPPASQAAGTGGKITEESIAAVLARHLGNGSNGSGGRQPAIPWSELGLGSGGPRMAGVECDLRLLWRLAYAEGGGFEAVGAANRWARVAQDMGADLRRIPNAAFRVRAWYQRFLLPYERHLQQQQQNGSGGSGGLGGGGKRKAAAESEDSGPAVASPAEAAAGAAAAAARQK